MSQTCPRCGARCDDSACFCASCGKPVAAAPNLEAPTFEPCDVPKTGASASPRPHARFEPGTLLAGRYRIVGLLGRGGMGEVYRADDLTLNQPVALKFLPSEAENEDRLERFRGEVRIARRVSHPN